MGDIVPRRDVVATGTKAVGGVLGGAALLFLSGLGLWPGLIVGGLIGAFGLNTARKEKDRTEGLIVAGAGGLTAIAALNLPILGGLATLPLILGGLGLIVFGGINVFKFIKDYRSRK
jgi:pimeloyl-ACP methyl ester carboxylesterase